MWTLAGFGIANAIRLGSNLILTRLVEPEAFGVMAITTAILTWLDMLSDFGIKPSIIRSRHGEESGFLATALTMQFTRGVGLAAVVVMGSLVLQLVQRAGWFPADSVYADVRLPHFLQIIAAANVVGGLTSPKLILKERDLIMRPVVQLAVVAQVISILAILSLAHAGWGAYSLVVGTAVGSLAKTIGSHVLVDGPKVGFGIQKQHFQEIVSYGRWLVVASFFGFLVNRGGQLLLGYYVDQLTFSLYAIGAMWVSTAKALMQQVVQKVGYPVFSEIGRDRPEDRTRIYYRARLALDATAFAAFAAAYLLSPWFFSTFYTVQYHGVARFVRLTALGLLLVPYNLLNTVILAQGQSRGFTVVTAVPGVALVIGVPAGFHMFGFEAAIIFVSVLQLFAIPFIWGFARKTVKLNPLRESVPLVLTVLAVAAVYAFED